MQIIEKEVTLSEYITLITRRMEMYQKNILEAENITT